MLEKKQTNKQILKREPYAGEHKGFIKVSSENVHPMEVR